MEWLNYHHLLYFWTVAREGSVTKAARQLHLAQSSISGQLRSLERAFGTRLLERSGRNIAMTETGRMVFRYADEIFTVGRELQDAVRGRPVGRPVRFTVGVADTLSKLIVHRLLEPALKLATRLHLVCHDGEPHRLLAQLAVHELDLVLADVPADPSLRIRAFNHLLGECGVTFFGSAALAAKYRRGFPRSLAGAPFLMPTANSSTRRALEQWFDAQAMRPASAGEFADSALLKVFGQVGAGLFVAPSAIEAEVQRQYHVRVIGRTDAIRERFYAISIEKRLKHPAVVAIRESAQTMLFR